MEDEKKTGFARRLVKFVLWFALGLFVFAVLAAVTLPLWINPVATCVANRVVPGLTSTEFRIERFYLNPYSGSLRIGGVKLSNPRNFGSAAAFSVSRFDVDMVVGSLFSDTIFVKDMIIEDPFVSYYSHEGKNNFDVILSNVKGTEGSEKTGNASVAEPKTEQKSPGKKIIIEHLRVSGTKVKLMKSDLMPPLMMPPVELTDIGKKSGGATIHEAWTQIANGVMKSVSVAGDELGVLGGIIGDGMKDASGKFNGGMKGTVDAVNDTTKKAAEGVKNLFKGFGK